MERLIFPGIRKTTVLRRLRRLKRARLIERITGLPFGEHAWQATRLGASRVGDGEAIASVSKNTLEHATELSAARLMLENKGVAHGWVPEHQLKRQWGIEERRRSHEFTVVPDALFAAIVKGQTRIISMELELHAKGRRLYRKLFEEYPKNVPIWKVWYIVPDPKVARVVLSVWKEMAPKGREDWIVWSLLSDVKTNLAEARVHSLQGSLAVSKWVQVQNESGDLTTQKTWKKPAQPPAQGLSREADFSSNPKIKNHEEKKEVTQILESRLRDG